MEARFQPTLPGDIAQEAIEHCATAMLLADAEGLVLYANAAARALFGCDADELRQHRLTELLPEVARIPHQSGKRTETLCQRSDGERLAVEVALSRPESDGGQFQLACIREIGVRNRLEDQLREARKLEPVGRLVAGVSHDFNNLLTAILIYSGLLLSQLPPESPLRRPSEQINRAAERGRSLVDQLTALGGRRQFELST
jgi:two-component system, cell cycle sensor histidine kinase and response regulator CckA